MIYLQFWIAEKHVYHSIRGTGEMKHGIKTKTRIKFSRDYELGNKTSNAKPWKGQSCSRWLARNIVQIHGDTRYTFYTYVIYFSF